MSRTLDEHLSGSGPKRILALDGGGIRGVLTLAYLQRMEDLLRARHGDDPDFRLADYFDLIGGTSTGAIIAAGLALGHSVAHIRAVYETLGKRVFRAAPWRLGVFGAKFPAETLEECLVAEFGDVALGDERIRTGLAIIAKRFDTGSPWILHNNPRGRYFEPSAFDPEAVPNRDLRLRDLVRASAAAPYYFEPERIRIAAAQDGAFVDGGVSPFNNPAMLLFVVASVPAYGFSWPVGADRLLLTSVGTGARTVRFSVDNALDMSPPVAVVHSLKSLIADCDAWTQVMLQLLSNGPTAWSIDSEIEDLDGATLGGREWLHYLRYNVRLEADWLNRELGMALDEREAEDLYRMDRPENIAPLFVLGARAAEKQIVPAHFPADFDAPTTI